MLLCACAARASAWRLRPNLALPLLRCPGLLRLTPAFCCLRACACRFAHGVRGYIYADTCHTTRLRHRQHWLPGWFYRTGSPFARRACTPPVPHHRTPTTAPDTGFVLRWIHRVHVLYAAFTTHCTPHTPLPDRYACPPTRRCPSPLNYTGYRAAERPHT